MLSETTSAILKIIMAKKTVSKKPVSAKKTVSKKSKKAEQKQPLYKRLTIFQIKVAVSVVIVWLSYRYPIPIDSLRNQELLTLIAVSVFLLWKPSPYHRLMKKFSLPKVMSVLVYFVIIFPLLMICNAKYQDWDNAQMIKGLARDFPKLVEEIEAATGLDLEIKKNCMTTTEKFSSGVRTCEVSVVAQASQDSIDRAVGTALNSKYLGDISQENSRGYRIQYRRKSSCTLTKTATVYVSCITAVRDTNVETAKEVFNNIPR